MLCIIVIYVCVLYSQLDYTFSKTIGYIIYILYSIFPLPTEHCTLHIGKCLVNINWINVWLEEKLIKNMMRIGVLNWVMQFSFHLNYGFQNCILIIWVFHRQIWIPAWRTSAFHNKLHLVLLHKQVSMNTDGVPSIC